MGFFAIRNPFQNINVVSFLLGIHASSTPKNNTTTMIFGGGVTEAYIQLLWHNILAVIVATSMRTSIFSKKPTLKQKTLTNSSTATNFTKEIIYYFYEIFPFTFHISASIIFTVFSCMEIPKESQPRTETAQMWERNRSRPRIDPAKRTLRQNVNAGFYGILACVQLREPPAIKYNGCMGL